jgi:hypothetical protein
MRAASVVVTVMMTSGRPLGMVFSGMRLKRVPASNARQQMLLAEFANHPGRKPNQARRFPNSFVPTTA